LGRPFLTGVSGRNTTSERIVNNKPVPKPVLRLRPKCTAAMHVAAGGGTAGSTPNFRASLVNGPSRKLIHPGFCRSVSRYTHHSWHRSSFRAGWSTITTSPSTIAQRSLHGAVHSGTSHQQPRL